MSARAAPSGSSRYVSEVDLFPYMARLVEQQESTLAAQQQLIEQGNTIIKQLKEIACGPGFIKEDESEESDEEPPLQDERLPGMLAMLLHCTSISYSYSFTRGL